MSKKTTFFSPRVEKAMNPVILEADLIINNDLDWLKIGS